MECVELKKNIVLVIMSECEDDRYLKGGIYEIVCNNESILGDNEERLRYIGSTINFNGRKAQHIKSYKDEDDFVNWNNKLYRTIRSNGGLENFEFKYLRDAPCICKRDLVQIEERMRVECKANMNSNKAYVEDKKQARKEYSKKFYSLNKKEMIERNLKYYYENRPKVLEREKKKYWEKKTIQLTLKNAEF